MGMNITQKIIKNHLVEGEMIPGEQIGIKIDQTLTQDSTGTMAYLQLEAILVQQFLLFVILYVPFLFLSIVQE